MIVKNTSKSIKREFLFDSFYNYSIDNSEVRKLTNNDQNDFYHLMYILNSQEKFFLHKAVHSHFFDKGVSDDLDFVVKTASRISFNLKSELPSFVDSIRRIKSSFSHNKTYFSNLIIINNLPSTLYSYRLEALLGALMGTIMHYPNEGSPIMTLKENPKDPCIDPSFQNLIDFPAHTDLSYVKQPPEIMGVHYINDDNTTNGHPFFCDVKSVVNNLDEKVKQELSRPIFRFTCPQHYKGMITGSVPILAYQFASGWKIRFRPDKLIFLEKTPKVEYAIEKLIDSIKQNIFKIKISNGSFVFINNQTLLHGREGYRCSSINSSTPSTRHLTRMYIS